MSKTKQIPQHLKKYVVSQDYSQYTSEDQAVWRYIMRQLKDFLSRNAHGCYVEGLDKTGISIESIPKIDVMNEKLNKFGWGAVPVSGFIPPAAFMEFQSLGFLPIACDMRTIDHILYTPAPDIVHEAAGHAPILVNPTFADYLRRYADVAAKSIISHEDMSLYEGIRKLSDTKEHPDSTQEEIDKAEKELEEITRNLSYVSEAGYLSRMNWWTAEYGLIGSLEDPKIFGAGLLSSVGESRDCLKSHVKKMSLDISCLDYSYDITEPQPQLFVTPDFQRLIDVLEELADTMAFRQGGKKGLKKAVEAQTVNTVELDSGIQISGQLVNFLESPKTKETVYLQFNGPCQLSYKGKELKNHGIKNHPHGYGTPVGNLNEKEIKEGKHIDLEFESGIKVSGNVDSKLYLENSLALISFSNCTVTYENQVLFKPEWGTFDMAVGKNIPSVFGGAADKENYGELTDFVAARVPRKQHSKARLKEFDFYQRIRNFREKNTKDKTEWQDLLIEFHEKHPHLWLAGIELLELGYTLSLPKETLQTLIERLQGLGRENSELKERIEDGLRLADAEL